MSPQELILTLVSEVETLAEALSIAGDRLIAYGNPKDAKIAKAQAMESRSLLQKYGLRQGSGR